MCTKATDMTSARCLSQTSYIGESFPSFSSHILTNQERNMQGDQHSNNNCRLQCDDVGGPCA